MYTHKIEQKKEERKKHKTEHREKTDNQNIKQEMQTDSEADRTERMGCKTDKQKELVQGWLGGQDKAQRYNDN